MSIIRAFDILFLVCNGYLVIMVGQPWQATLSTIMNTRYSYDLRDLAIFLWDGKGDSQRLLGVHMGAKGSSSSSIKKKKNNTK